MTPAVVLSEAKDPLSCSIARDFAKAHLRQRHCPCDTTVQGVLRFAQDDRVAQRTQVVGP